MFEFLRLQAAEQSGRLFLWLPVALAIGIAAYFNIRFEPQVSDYALIIGLGATLSTIAILAKARWLAFWTIGLVLGFCLAGFQAQRLAAPKLAYRYYGPVEGRILSVDRSARERPRILLDQVQLGRLPPYRTPKYVRVSLHFEEAYLHLQPGKSVMLTAYLSPPASPTEAGGFDFERHAWFLQLGAVGYSRTPVLEVAPPQISGAKLRLNALRQSLAEHIRSKLGGAKGAFAAAILVGDRAAINKSDLEALRAANLAHLLAISGLHMGLLTGIVFISIQLAFAVIPRIALRMPVRKIAAIGAIFTAVFYLGISGASIATQRAFLMAIVLFTAALLERRAITLQAVAAAASLLLILRPHSLNEAGFQMSFAATTGLVAVFALLRDVSWMRFSQGKYRRAANWFFGLALSSAIAGAATAPFSAYHFNQISQFGLLANVLSVPVMGLVIMPGAVFATLATPVGLDALGWQIVGAGITWILSIAHWVSSFENATRSIVKPEGFVFAALVSGLIFLTLWRGILRLFALPVILTAMVLWSGTKRPDVLISSDGMFYGVMTSQGRALNKPRGHGFAAMSWLENDGDPVEQEEAAERQIVDDLVDFHAAKTGTASCGTAPVVIAPRVISDPADCLILDKSHFRQLGATAIWLTPSALIIRTSRGQTGDRRWNQRR